MNLLSLHRLSHLDALTEMTLLVPESTQVPLVVSPTAVLDSSKGKAVGEPHTAKPQYPPFMRVAFLILTLHRRNWLK